jgi:hypothetical protein
MLARARTALVALVAVGFLSTACGAGQPKDWIVIRKKQDGTQGCLTYRLSELQQAETCHDLTVGDGESPKYADCFENAALGEPVPVCWRQ